MKKGFAIAILLLFGLTFMGQIRQIYYPWGELEFHVNALNMGTKHQDDLHISVYMPSLGIYTVSSPFDLNDGHKTSKFISVYAPEAKGNAYIARFVLSNDNVRDVRYVWANFY